MKTHFVRISKLILASFVIVLCSQLQVKAQVPGCVDPPPPPTNVPYEQSQSQLFNYGPNCDVLVTFCTRHVMIDGVSVIDFYISQIEAQNNGAPPNCDDLGINFATVLNWANFKVETLLGVNAVDCNLGKGVQVSITQNTATCWSMISPTPDPTKPYGGLQFNMCRSETGWCQMVYRICRDAGGNLTRVLLSSNSVPGLCLDRAPTTTAWTPAYCYLITTDCTP